MSFYKTKVSKDKMELIMKFKVDETKCDNPEHYESYLMYNALNDINQGFSTTYLYIEENEQTEEKNIMGYITLRMSSFIKDMGESRKYGYPALEIAELAVDKNYTGRGIGTDMVMDTITIANELNEIISVKYIVLCADPRVQGFYEKLEFQKMYDRIEDIPREHFNLSAIPMYIKLR